MKYIILAGGFATRLWPLTEKRAKPLLLLAGKTILAHIYDMLPEGADVILLTNDRFKYDFMNEINHIGHKNTIIFCEDAHSAGEKLGAVKALSMAINVHQINESVCVIAGDNLLTGLSLLDMDCHDNEAKVAVREVDSLDEAKKFGVVQAVGGQVVEFKEKPENPESKLVSTGFMSFGKDLIPSIHECAVSTPDSLGSIFTEFLCEGKFVTAVEADGEWFDVGSFETYLEAHKKLQKDDLEGEVECHDNVFSGKVYVGKGTKINNCQILDSIIYPGVTLSNCHISQSVIDKDCVLEGVDINQKLVRAGTNIKG